MHKAHKDSEGIPKYINTLEEGWYKAAQAGANEDWEELEANDKTWAVWKKLYRAAAKKAAIKSHASGGRDQFGAAHAVTET